MVKIFSLIFALCLCEGEDEKSLLARGWSKDKETIEEISRQRSKTTTDFLTRSMLLSPTDSQLLQTVIEEGNSDKLHSSSAEKGKRQDKEKSKEEESIAKELPKKQTAIVLYDFISEHAEELDITTNDIVTVLEKSNDEWW